MQLTDQALVAVTLARQIARDRPVNAAHLLGGLAAEEDGAAGRLLRGEPGWVRLATHPAVDAPSLPSFEAVLRAAPAASRPLWTVDLLAAALRVGGEELDEVLDAVGVTPPEPDELEVEESLQPDDRAADEEPAETYGRWSLDEDLTDEADLAVARARARGGASDALAVELGALGARWEALRALPPVPIDDVVALARQLRGDRTADVADLLDAIALVAARAAVRLHDD